MTWLTRGGVAAALLVGGAVWWGLGWSGLAPLFAFFVTASLLTLLAGEPNLARTARQVVANGAVAALAALVGRWPEAAGAIAAAAADTWATEIGGFSRHSPRLITTWAPTPRGASGGITLLGTVGGTGGALLIALVSSLVAPRLRGPGVWVVAAAGIAGMLVDSLLGATLQARYACPDCGTVKERPGRCHTSLVLIRGVRWLDNDGVNLMASLAGAFAAGVGSLVWF